MKIVLFAFLCFFLFNNAFGQGLPPFPNDTTRNAPSKSLALQYFKKEYSTMIVYSRDCYKPLEQEYVVMALKDSTWQLFRWKVKFKEGGKTVDNIRKAKKKKLKLENVQVDSLFYVWNKQNFWKLHNDSINVRERYFTTEMRTFVVVSGGCADQFEMITDGRYRLISAYEADYTQQQIPTRQRAQFITARDRFLGLLCR